MRFVTCLGNSCNAAYVTIANVSRRQWVNTGMKTMGKLFLVAVGFTVSVPAAAADVCHFQGRSN